MKSTFTHSTKLLVFIIISIFSLTNYTFSQTFPDASSCTSKDLELVELFYRGDLCNLPNRYSNNKIIDSIH
jgi:hypothetical protein